MSSYKCPDGTRLLKKPVKENGRVRYCTKPKKSRRRKSQKKSGKSTTKSRRRKSQKKSSAGKRYKCQKVYGTYGEYVTSQCQPGRRGKYESEDHCLKSGCEDYDPYNNYAPTNYTESACNKRWCTGNLAGKKWKICYHKNALKYHPDKGGGKEAERKFQELGQCNEYSKFW